MASGAPSPWWKDKTREYSVAQEAKAAMFMVGGGLIVTIALGAIFVPVPGMTNLWQQVFAAHAFGIAVANLVAGVVLDTAVGFGTSLAHALVSRDTLMFAPELTLREVNVATASACVIYVGLGVGGIVEKVCAKIPYGFPAALMMSVGILLLISAAELSGLVPREPDPNPFAAYGVEQWLALGVLAVMLAAVVTVGAASVIVVVLLHLVVALGLAADTLPETLVAVPDVAALLPEPTGLTAAPIALALHVLLVICILVVFESITVGGLSSAVMASRNFTQIMKIEDDKFTSRIIDGRNNVTFGLIGLGNIVSAVFAGTPLIVLLDQAAIVKAGSKTGIPCLISAMFWVVLGLLAPVFAVVPIQVPSVAAMSIGAMLLGRASLIQWDNWTDTASASFMIMLVVVRQQLTPGVLAYVVVFGVLETLQKVTGGKKLEDQFNDEPMATDIWASLESRKFDDKGKSIVDSPTNKATAKNYAVQEEQPEPTGTGKLFGDDLVVEEFDDENKKDTKKSWVKAKTALRKTYGLEFDNSEKKKLLGTMGIEEMFAQAIHTQYKPMTAEERQNLHRARASVNFQAKDSSMEESIYLFDCHMQIINHFQSQIVPSDDIRKMLVSAGVAFANMYGCPFVKMQTAGEPDDKTLPLYSNLDRIVPTPANDWRLASILKKQNKAVLVSNEHVDIAKAGLVDQLYPQRTTYSPMILPMIGGINLNDTNCVRHVQALQEAWGLEFFRSFGVASLKHEGCNLNVTGVQTLDSKGAAKLLRGVQKLNMPFVFHCDAAPVSEKKHLTAYKNIKECEGQFRKFNQVNFVWMHGGVAVRGIYKNYGNFLKKLLADHPNLHISITPSVVLMNTKRDGATTKIDFAELCDYFPHRFMVGTEDTGSESYSDQIQILRDFIKTLPQHSRVGVAWKNATEIFIAHKPPPKMRVLLPEDAIKSDLPPAAGPVWDTKPDASNETGYYKTIDSHMHMLDFIHRSTGIQSMLRQMDICNVSKGILFGMPCCKKWSFIHDKSKPLYYQDSYSLCYEYALQDQMIADAWLALPENQRRRFACCISGFKPTDLGAVDHIDRMYRKYPGMWRGVGEIMCRHDDLSTMLPDLETPAANHPAMMIIYEWAIEHDLPCLVHHNANYFHHNTARLKPDQVGVYAEEVCEVLQKYPKLKFIWCHAGISRSCFGIAHHAILDGMLERFNNLWIDISWVVYETTICKPKSFMARDEWLQLFEKYPKRFVLGSDAVGQYEMPEWLRAATNAPVHGLYGPQIVKYQETLNALSKETREALAWKNCEELFFQGWSLPPQEGRYSRLDPTNEALCLVVHDDKQGEEHGEWIPTGEMF
jgi:predicted TIM-barrel fold metal-dependent hydrolase/xanthine/uracil/vitamin C permease (AzgA family)